MGGVRKRWRELVPQNWEALPEEIKKGTPENLLRHFEERGAIDDPAILRRMKDDVTEGKLPKEDGIDSAERDAEAYYGYWGGCLNYKFIHEGMAQDIKKSLAGQTNPDVVIMIAGRAHIQGLNQQFDRQLPEFADSQKVVIRNSKEVVIDGVGQLIEFEFDKEKREALIPEAVKLEIDARSQAKNKTYDKGLNPTTKEFTSYINGSNDWANIGKEIQYFIGLLDSENEFERVDAKGYVLTCMFKILGAIDEFDSKKTGKDGKLIRPNDPRKDIDPSVQDFLGGDLSKEAVRLKTLKYSQEIIEEYGEEKTAPALSSAASAYGVRAYMQYLGLLTEGEASPNQEPQKYYQGITDPKLSENTKKNIALAMEKFEESAALGNVRSMGSVVYWAGLSNHPKLQELNEKWTKEAATASTQNPNSQIDYAKILESRGDYKEAEKMLQSAVDFGLDKASLKLEAFHQKQQRDKIAAFGFVALGHNFREKPLGSIVYTKDEKDEVMVVVEGSRDFYDPSSPMKKDTVSGIGSITKQFTSAALLKLWDNELTKLKANSEAKTWFPEGVDSKLVGFMSELKVAYPSCAELFARIESDEHYQDITLRDLLNHTHGLGARNNDKALDLVIQSNANPLAFSAIANTTEKREGEVYGKHQYGNFGYDLAGMIIEIVARDTGTVAPEVPMDGEVFDAALHALVLDPNGLSNTHTQTDTRASWEQDPSKFAMGYEFIYTSDRVEASGKSHEECQKAFNLISNTRAAGGLKSTVENLAKFAPRFMGAEMFESEQVKQVVLDRSRGAKMPEQEGNTYHLAIQGVMMTRIGHPGGELTY